MTTVTVKLVFSTLPHKEDLEELTDLLPTSAVALIDGRSGRTEITLPIRGSDISLALQRALKLSELLSPLLNEATPDAVEILTEREQTYRENLPTYPSVCGVKEIAAKARITTTRASELAQSRGFPAPIGRLAAGPVFAEEQVDSFLARWERRPGRPRRVTA